MSPERTPEWFDQWASYYDYYVRSESDRFPFAGYDDILDRIVELSEPKPGMKILDVGIGTGTLAQKFTEFDCEIWGIDYSPMMLAEAKKKVPDAHLLLVDIQSEWPSELMTGFDRIVSAYVLHHFPLETKLDIIRRMINELLAENGRIVIGDTSYPTFTERADARRELIDVWDDTEFYWAADTIKDRLRGGNITVCYEQTSSCAGIYLLTPVCS
ncbi:MAG: class I SAM-dependent methyltransferase [Candidatus Thorarchaeota archaeon]|jgi:putative AdoMet-dependent methyltransferase